MASKRKTFPINFRPEDKETLSYRASKLALKRGVTAPSVPAYIMEASTYFEMHYATKAETK
jgi:hypothetical protein